MIEMEDKLIISNASCTCGMSLEEAEQIFEPIKFVLEECVSIGINVFGLIANSIALRVLFKHELKTLFIKTLFMLAVFDVVFNICDILETIRLVHYDNESCLPMPSYQKIHLYLSPQFMYPLRMFVVISSMYTTVVIALERYLAVSKPVLTFVESDESTWKKLFSILTPVIIGSLILTLPRSFEFFIDTKCFLCLNNREVQELSMDTCENLNIVQVSGTNDTVYQCDNADFVENTSEKVSDDDENCYFRTILKLQWKDIRLNKIYSIVYRNIVLNIITYVIPLVMLFVLNWLIYKHLKRRTKEIKDLGKYIYLLSRHWKL